MTTVLARPALFLESVLQREGFTHQPVALVADLKAIAESCCPECGAAELQVWPFWRGPVCRLVLRCPSCHLRLLHFSIH